MMTSPYDGASRATLRGGIAVLFAVDVVAQARTLGALHPGGRAHPLAPAALLALGGATVPLVALAVLGLGAIALFATRRHTMLAGAVALGVLGLLTESAAALSNGPSRSYFPIGAVLLGWLAGLAFRRIARASTPTNEADEANEADDADDALGETGALAALAGTYACAALSKLSHVGLAWADSETLRGVILSHHVVGDGSLAGRWEQAVVTHPGLSAALAVATLGIQGGAFVMLVGPRARLFWAALLFAFHTNVELLAHIGYMESRALLLLFAVPWPALARRIARTAKSPAVDDDVAAGIDAASLRRATLLAVAVAAALVAMALPLREYTSLHHHHDRPHGDDR